MLRRTLNRVSTVLTFGSLLIALVAVGLWVRGQFVQDDLQWSRRRIVRGVFADDDQFVRESTWFAFSGDGGLGLGSHNRWLDYGGRENRLKPSEGTYLRHDTDDPAYPIWPADEKPPGVVQYTLGGFQFRMEDLGGAYEAEPGMVDGQVVMRKPRIPMDRSGVYVTVPLWAVVVCALVAPAGWFMSHRNRRRAARRRERGACLGCGYDLRSGGGREHCPECGTASAADAPAAASSA